MERPAPSFTVALSPEQRVSGFISGSAGGLDVRLVILPKLWRPEGRQSQFRVDWRDDSLEIVGYEGDRICIGLEGAESEKRELLDAVLAESCDRGVGDRLVTIDVSRSTLPLMPAASLSSNCANLMELAAAAGARFVETACEAAARDGDFAEWIEPILHERFVWEVRAALPGFRRGYVEVAGRSTSPRGKIDVLSAALAESSGDCRLRFLHDDFRLDTPVLRVVRCALELVARSPPPSVSAMRNRWRTNRQAAERLCDNLGFVRRISVLEAERVLRHHLNSADHRRISCLQFARLVLRRAASIGARSGEALGAQRHCDGGSAFISRVEIPTWQVWQEFIIKALRLHGIAGPGYCDGPWAGLGRGAMPDVVFQRVGHRDAMERFVLDAKYKYPVDVPSAADAYQLFVYSHLFDPEQTLFDTVGLIYPSPNDGDRTVAFRRTQIRMTSAGMRLVISRSPWPSVADLHGMDAYFVRLGASILGSLKLAHT